MSSPHSAFGAIQITPRPLASYRAMFGLTDEEIVGRRLLDCPAGASPFAAQVRARGGAATSVDPAYGRPRTSFERVVREGIAASSAFARTLRDTLDWDHVGSTAALAAVWETSADLFFADYADGHHVAAALPRLPFRDRSFDLAVSGFLYFYYQDQLGLDDHVAALAELSRVADEVRVHPLVDSRGVRSPHVEPVRRLLAARGVHTELRPADGSDLLAATETLVCRRHRTGDETVRSNP